MLKGEYTMSIMLSGFTKKLINKTIERTKRYEIKLVNTMVLFDELLTDWDFTEFVEKNSSLKIEEILESLEDALEAKKFTEHKLLKLQEEKQFMEEVLEAADVKDYEDIKTTL